MPVNALHPCGQLSIHRLGEKTKPLLRRGLRPFAKAAMFRKAMASEWTAAALGVVMVCLHIAWFCASSHQGEVLSGMGGSVTVLGILVAAQPYIRKGVRQAGREQAGLAETQGDRQHPDAEHDEAEAAGVRHVLKERVVGVALIGFGSLLNAYGPAIASALAMKGAN